MMPFRCQWLLFLISHKRQTKCRCSRCRRCAKVKFVKSFCIIFSLSSTFVHSVVRLSHWPRKWKLLQLCLLAICLYSSKLIPLIWYLRSIALKLYDKRTRPHLFGAVVRFDISKSFSIIQNIKNFVHIRQEMLANKTLYYFGIARFSVITKWRENWQKILST